MAVCSLHCSGRTRRALGSSSAGGCDQRWSLKLGMSSRLTSSWKHVVVASECKTGLQKAEECEYSHPPFIFITIIAWLYTSLSLTCMVYRRHRLLKAFLCIFLSDFYYYFLLRQHTRVSTAMEILFLTRCLETKIRVSSLPYMGALFFLLLEVFFLAWTYFYVG